MLTEFGLPLTSQDEQPAVWLDWMLAIRDTENKVRAEKIRAAEGAQT